MSDRDHDDDVLPGALLGGAAAQLRHIYQIRVGGELRKNLLLWMFHQTYAGRPKRWDTDPEQLRRGMRIHMDPKVILRDLGYDESNAKGMISTALTDLENMGLIRYDREHQCGVLIPYTLWPKLNSGDAEEEGKARGRTVAAAAVKSSRPNAGAPPVVYRPEPGTPLSERKSDKYGKPLLAFEDVAELLDSPLHPASEALVAEVWIFVEWYQRATNETIHADRGDLHELCGWLTEDGFASRELIQRCKRAFLHRSGAHTWPFLQRCLNNPKDGWRHEKHTRRAVALTHDHDSQEQETHGDADSRQGTRGPLARTSGPSHRGGAGPYRGDAPATAAGRPQHDGAATLQRAEERTLRTLLADAERADAAAPPLSVPSAAPRPALPTQRPDDAAAQRGASTQGRSQPRPA